MPPDPAAAEPAVPGSCGVEPGSPPAQPTQMTRKDTPAAATHRKNEVWHMTMNSLESRQWCALRPPAPLINSHFCASCHFLSGGFPGIFRGLVWDVAATARVMGVPARG